MTSPSETPLDLDALRAALTEARGYAAKVKKAAQVLEGDARAEDAQEGRP